MKNTLTRARKNPLALACALMPLITLPLFAAETGNSANVEEVVVTASKRDQRLLDFAGSVSVIHNFENIRNVSGIANRVPGFNVVDAGPRNPAGLVIRGLRLDEVTANDLGGDGGTVATYLDNVPMQGFFAPLAVGMKDMQQIEVLRGPQGTLYGNASIGGLIRFVTNKPDLKQNSAKLHGEISQTQNSDDLNYDTEVVVNSPIITDVLGVRVMLSKTEDQGFIDNPYWLTGPAEDINDDERNQARVSLLWKPAQKFSLGFSHHYQKNNVADRDATNESFTGRKYTASSRFEQPMEGELKLTSLDADYEFDWATLSASLSHYDYERFEVNDQTDYLITLDSFYEEPYYTAMDGMYAVNAAAVDVVKDSFELRLISANEQRFRWLAGVFYSRDDLDVNMGDFIPGFGDFAGEDRLDDMDFLSTQAETLDEYSVYGEVSYDITPRWEATLGLRHFRYDDKLNLCVEFFPQDPFCEGGDDTIKDSLGKFSTRYKIAEQQSIYFMVAEGYRRGGANVLPEDSLAKRTYDPDTAVNYEVGYRASLMQDRINLDASIFRTVWDDLQIATASPSGLIYWINLGEARSEGVELEGTFSLNDFFTLRANYSYHKAEIVETVFFAEGEGANAYKRDVLPGSPEDQWSVGLDYNRAYGSMDVDASISANNFGEMYTALNEGFYNYQKLDSFMTTDISAGVTLGNIRVGAFVNNVGNTRGISGKRSNEWHGEQGQFEYINRPRTLGMSLTYNY